MANILIADLREQSAYLLRALYKGFGHKSIIAIDPEIAKSYAETGVFDILIADLTIPDVEIIEIVKLVHDLVPVMPIIAIISKDRINQEIDDILFAKIGRPIDTKRIEQTLSDALEHIEQTCINKRADKRSEVSLPVLINLDNSPVPAQGKDLSTNGIAIEIPANTDIAEDQLISAAIQLPDDSFEVTGTVSFIKQEKNCKIIGLQFVSKKTVRFKCLGNFLNKAS